MAFDDYAREKAGYGISYNENITKNLKKTYSS